jgi:hypothetical protein
MVKEYIVVVAGQAFFEGIRELFDMYVTYSTAHGRRREYVFVFIESGCRIRCGFSCEIPRYLTTDTRFLCLFYYGQVRLQFSMLFRVLVVLKSFL